MFFIKVFKKYSLGNLYAWQRGDIPVNKAALKEHTQPVWGNSHVRQFCWWGHREAHRPAFGKCVCGGEGGGGAGRGAGGGMAEETFLEVVSMLKLER